MTLEMRERERSKRLEAECIETRQKTEELWAELRPEPKKIDYYYPPHLIRLHIELLDFGTEEPSEKLFKAVKAEKGISRDIIVPANMTLHALHYAIQRLFGFLGYHLNNFSLSQEDFNLVTAARLGGYTDLCGVLFRYSDQFEGDEGWDNDYDGESSVNTWLKKMYRAPYYKGNIGDTWYANWRSIAQIHDEHPEIKDEMLLLEADEILYPERNRNYLREDVTVGEMLTSTGKMKTDAGVLDFMADRREAVKTWKADILGKIADEEGILENISDEKSEEGVVKILDRFCASLNNIRLGYEGDDIAYSVLTQDLIFDRLAVHPLPFFKEIYYNYDYGDNWDFKISAVEEYQLTGDVLPGEDNFDEMDLFKASQSRNAALKKTAVKRLCYEDASGKEVDEELREKLAECDVYGRPFCIAADGLNLVEDVGGTRGFENFILSVNGKPETDDQKEERKENLLWAKDLGWTGRESRPEKML